MTTPTALRAKRRLSLPKFRALLFSCLLFIVLLSLIEFSCYLTFRHPHLVPSGFAVNLLRANYLNNRDFIQYDKMCARYDSTVTYTLRPGTCTFQNVEFKVTCNINHAGLRDDESSLDKPELIVLGDSHAMGWGVEQNDSFPELLQQKLRSKVLNAAISSYGTAREVLTLRRLDRRNLHYLIVQYCPNDFSENYEFINNNYALQVMTRQEFDAIADDVGKFRNYFPGRYITHTIEIQILRRLKRMVTSHSTIPDYTGPLPRAKSPQQEALYFIKTLDHANVNITGIPIIVLAIDSYKAYDGRFLSALNDLTHDKNANPHSLDIRSLDLSNDLTDKDFFKLDDHLNKHGHYVVSMKLAQMLAR